MKIIGLFRVLFSGLFLSLWLAALLPMAAMAEEGNPPAEPIPGEAAAGDSDDYTKETLPEGQPVGEPSEAESDALQNGSEQVIGDVQLAEAADVESAMEGLSPDELLMVETEGAPEAEPSDDGQPGLDEITNSTITDVQIVDEAGEPLPMATEEAAEILATGDPIWCPASVKVPKPNTSGCTQSFGSLDALFSELEVHPKTVDGIIWIEKTYSDSNDATLDGDPLGPLSTMRNFKLTLKGGWNGCTPSCIGTIDTTNPSEIEHQLEILDWNNDVTLSDLLVTGVTSPGEALLVQTSGKITLTRVEVSNNGDSGARLENTAGTKDVSIASGQFDHNTGGDGLNVISNGTVTLVGVTASENEGMGVYIKNDTAALPRNVSLSSGVFEFNNNAASGLVIVSDGLVTLRDITATTNGGDGAYVDNVSSPTTQGVTLLGTNVFSENHGSGLVVQSSGPIIANNLVNNANTNYAASFDNTAGVKTFSITLSGSNEFKFNGTGLRIVSDGAITLNNIVATNNTVSYGANLNNSSSTAASSVTLNGTNNFSENQQDGLRVLSAGVVTISKVTANGNGKGAVTGNGLWLDNTSAETPKAVVLVGANTFSDNLEDGLNIHSDGTITISILNIQGNEGDGAEISNLGAGASPQNVAFTGAVNSNSNSGAGLVVNSLGMISLVNVTANFNGGLGTSLNNVGAVPKPITFSGTNYFSNNGANGLTINSTGAITLNNIHANVNAGVGASIQNNGGGSVGTITINGINEFSENTAEGLVVGSRGNIQIANVAVTGNGGTGVTLDNAENGSLGNVVLGTKLAAWCNSLSENAGSGLDIVSNGMVTLLNVCAVKNGNLANPGFGTVIDNRTATSAKAVVITGINLFNENYSGGLSILSDGAITASNLVASNNVHGFGATLNNTSGGVGFHQLITLSGANQFSTNYGNGFTAISYGAISASNLSASSNGANSSLGYGASLDNCVADLSGCTQTATFAIVLSGANTFNSNEGDGLYVDSLGPITINNLEADGNEGNGAILDNGHEGAKGGITLLVKAVFVGNEASGLDLSSRGAIRILNLEASSNFGYGATISNLNAPLPQYLTLNGITKANENGDFGLVAESLGAITVSSLTASYNTSFGALVDNAEPGAIGAITLAGTQSILDNGSSGLYVESNRTITINNLTAGQNTGFGALLVNDDIGLPFDVKLTGNNSMNENGLSGLEINTLGAITLNNLTATLNGQSSVVGDGYGVFLDNLTGSALTRSVTLTGFGVFNENFDDGLLALSLGAIKTNSLTALSNGGAGASLDNHLGASTAGITLTGLNVFRGNDDLGLSITSSGLISLANITAEENLSGGAKLDNSGVATAPVDVILSGTNVFNDNGVIVSGSGSGLLVNSQGKITLKNVTANGNGFYGAHLNNKDYAAGTTPGITLTGVNTFVGNGNMGLYIQAAGDVNVTKIVADKNLGDGLNIISGKNVYVTCGSFTRNDGTGLFIYASFGKITLKGVFAYGNLFANTNPLPLSTVLVRTCPVP